MVKVIYTYQLKITSLTLIYPTHFEGVQCQSGVNRIYAG